MPVEQINGLGIAYEVIGQGQPWVITPGGRFSKDAPGVRELARALAADRKQVLIWDRPNTGASEVCFDGDSESVMQADVLAGLLRALGMAPAVISGGSGGSRVSLLAAARHPDMARALAVWWISGGPYGLLTLGTHYCGDSIAAAWRYGMDAVAALPEWAEVLERNPVNRAQVLEPGPPHLHRDPRAVDAGLLPSPGRTGSRPTRCRRVGDADSGPGVSQRRQ